MKLTILLISFFFGIQLSLLGQEHETINCLIFINGKLPDGSSLLGNFKAVNEAGDTMTYNFEPNIGEIILYNQIKKELFSISDGSLLLVTIKHVDRYGRIREFSTSIKAEWLKWRFIILRITTFKRGRYHFGISGPATSSEFIRQEYMMLEKF
ncbi:MAG: hypothetical protein KF852_16400 [Saprospiraceae bacterium]|nr:hypothetical protein [Saprospiraceae bacterium]